MSTEIPTKPLRRPLSRRAFLRALASTTAGVLVAACGPPRGDDRAAVRIALGPEATPQTILPSPVPDASPTPAAGTPALSLEEFLILSMLLTGVTNLNPELGHIYLQTLNTTQGAAALVDFATAAGLRSEVPPTDLDLLAATGVLDETHHREVATAITKLWYTGIYTNAAGEETVATFVDALAWKTLTFTKPMTICGEPGFWSEAWEVVLD